MAFFFSTSLILLLQTIVSADDLGFSSDRHLESVVLKGAKLPDLTNVPIDFIVGFAYSSILEEEWQQIPLQIDEMHWQNWDVIKNPGSDCRIVGRNATELVYADAKTLSGADENPNFDDDDELLFMVRHLGHKKPTTAAFPSNVLQFLSVEVTVTDPIDGGQGYVYFFISDYEAHTRRPLLLQNPGPTLVDYTFKLKTTDDKGSNEYVDVYKFTCDKPKDIHECFDEIMNPEDTWFKSPFYHRHFAENWHSDKVKIFTGDSNGQDFWGMEDFQFVLNDCSRSTKSFERGPTAFIANINGPIRAIRSWVGANSGVITYRTSKMYEQKEEQTTYVQVHTVPGMFDYINFQAGVPLTFHNCHNKKGFQVNGKMDASESEFNKEFCHWEMVTGASGTFLRTIDLKNDLENWFGGRTDENLFMRSWYYDNAIPHSIGNREAPEYPNGWSLCSALVDDQKEAWGTMGFKLKDELSVVPNTDPTRKQVYSHLPENACLVRSEPWLFNLTLNTVHYYLQPNISADKAEQLTQTSFVPLKVSINSLV